jgi:N-acetylglucosaminyl-diphospho-decaprenol L-rhamnosyltransferase
MNDLMEAQATSSLSMTTTNNLDIDLSVILVCWNNKTYLEPCLNSLYEGKLHNHFEVVVVDNGSSDGSQEMLRERFPDVNIIQNDHNLGLGKASNQGIEATCGRYILLLNNDTLVNGPSLDAMVEFLDSNPNVGAVGGKLLNPDGSIQACYNSFPSLHEEFFIATRLGEYLWKGYPGNITEEKIKTVSWLGSACLMLRRKALDQIGLLDEGYFIYGDETDLQYRLKKAGWLTYYLPQVTTVHFGGRSMDRWRRRKMVYRGKMLFFQKNYGSIRTWMLRGMLICLSYVKIIIWWMASFFPHWQAQAQKELNSNRDVIKLCWKLE